MTCYVQHRGRCDIEAYELGGDCMQCDYCAFYYIDEEDGQGECTVNLDEDDLARLLASPQDGCPYFQMDDEYKIVRKQM